MYFDKKVSIPNRKDFFNFNYCTIWLFTIQGFLTSQQNHEFSPIVKIKNKPQICYSLFNIAWTKSQPKGAVQSWFYCFNLCVICQKNQSPISQSEWCHCSCWEDHWSMVWLSTEWCDWSEGAVGQGVMPDQVWRYGRSLSGEGGTWHDQGVMAAVSAISEFLGEKIKLGNQMILTSQCWWTSQM